MISRARKLAKEEIKPWMVSSIEPGETEFELVGDQAALFVVS
jgi:hypothetical protein